MIHSFTTTISFQSGQKILVIEKSHQLE